MAIFMGNNVAVVFGTTTISSFVSTVSLTREVDQVEITALSDSVANMIAGIERPVLNLDEKALEIIKEKSPKAIIKL